MHFLPLINSVWMAGSFSAETCKMTSFSGRASFSSNFCFRLSTSNASTFAFFAAACVCNALLSIRFSARGGVSPKASSQISSTLEMTSSERPFSAIASRMAGGVRRTGSFSNTFLCSSTISFKSCWISRMTVFASSTSSEITSFKMPWKVFFSSAAVRFASQPKTSCMNAGCAFLASFT